MSPALRSTPWALLNALCRWTGVRVAALAGDGTLSPESMAPSISVVFPLYNEEDYVARAVNAAKEALGEAAAEWEIILVDDASTDRTGELADALAREDARVSVIHNESNRALGGTLRRGYAAATKELILYSDADLPFDLKELTRAVRLLEYQQADVLAAYRFDRTSEGLRRTVYTLAYSALIRTLFRLRLRDVNFSFKLFRRSLLARMPLKSEGSFIDAEFLVRARRAGASIIQIGVDYFPRTRGHSHLATPGVILRILSEMLRLWRELR
jgi:glycosyltransferase involved in cell wall biosynthesis